MSSSFLLYGATGFVGRVIARLAVENGLRPIVAGRSADRVQALAAELGLDHHVFALDDSRALDAALESVDLVLHCAGPYIDTFRPMVEACLRTGTHYLDITGELPVYAALAELDKTAEARGVMLLPGVGFDVVPTDCLALHLKQRLPSATHLALAFHSRGPARMPPGTARTLIEMIPYGNMVRRNERLQTVPWGARTRWIDFGSGPVKATQATWGDVFMAYYSTGIPNIEDYLVLPEMAGLFKALNYLQPLFRRRWVREFVKRRIPAGSTPEERARTYTSVWGEVRDDQGRTATARLHGPEAGVEWTSKTALTAVQRVLAGDHPPGFQTPALAFGAEFGLKGEGITCEDLQ